MIESTDDVYQIAEAAATLVLMSRGGAANMDWQKAFEQILAIVCNQQQQRLQQQLEQQLLMEQQQIDIKPFANMPLPEIRPSPNQRLMPHAHRAAKRRIKVEQVEVVPDILVDVPTGPSLEAILNRPPVTTVPVADQENYNHLQLPAVQDQKNLQRPRSLSELSGHHHANNAHKNLLCVQKKVYFTFLSTENREQMFPNVPLSDDFLPDGRYVYNQKLGRKQIFRHPSTDSAIFLSDNEEPAPMIKLESPDPEPIDSLSTPYMTPSPSISPEPFLDRINDYVNIEQQQQKMKMYKTAHFKKMQLATVPIKYELPELEMPSGRIEGRQIFPPNMPPKVRRYLDYLMIYVHKKKIDTIFAMNEFYSIGYEYNPRKSRVRSNYTDPKVALERTKNNIASRRSRQRKKFHVQTLRNSVDFDEEYIARLEKASLDLYSSAVMFEQLLQNTGNIESIIKARRSAGISC